MTVDQQEIQHFATLSHQWWDEQGPFKMLHTLNPVRIEYLIKHIQNHYPHENAFSNFSVLDVGCGGGLLSEPLARLGFKVCGVDACEPNIEIAKWHANEMDLNIDYRAQVVEEITEHFDIVCALEIIEHVSDWQLFVQQCCQRVRPGGLLFLSTINRTFKAYLLAVKLAEDVLNFVPKGTHQWQKFVRPQEVHKSLRRNALELIDQKGFVYDLYGNTMKISDNMDVNYILVASKSR